MWLFDNFLTSLICRLWLSLVNFMGGIINCFPKDDSVDETRKELLKDNIEKLKESQNLLNTNNQPPLLTSVEDASEPSVEEASEPLDPDTECFVVQNSDKCLNSGEKNGIFRWNQHTHYWTYFAEDGRTFSIYQRQKGILGMDGPMWVLNSIDHTCTSHTLYYSKKGIKWFSVLNSDRTLPIVKNKKFVREDMEEFAMEEFAIEEFAMESGVPKYGTPEIGENGKNDESGDMSDEDDDISEMSALESEGNQTATTNPKQNGNNSEEENDDSEMSAMSDEVLAGEEKKQTGNDKTNPTKEETQI